MLKGAFEKDPQKRNKDEPQPPEGWPECPDHLDDLAKIEWWFMCEMLERMDLLTTADRGMLEIYCQTYSQWRNACQQVSKYGAVLVQKTSQGNIPRRNPFDVIRERTATQCTRLLAEFGLSPSSRTSVGVLKTKKETEGALKYLA